MELVGQPVDGVREGSDNFPAPVDKVLQIDIVGLENAAVEWSGKDRELVRLPVAIGIFANLDRVVARIAFRIASPSIASASSPA